MKKKNEEKVKKDKIKPEKKFENKKKVKIVKKEKKTKKVKDSKNFFSKLKNKLIFWKKENEITYSLKEVIVIMLFSLGLGFFACLSFVKIFSNGRDYKILSQDLSKLVDTYSAIKNNYYGELNTEEIVDAAIKGMVGSLGDVYTSYSDITTTDDFMETVTGVYEGIGCTISMSLDNEIIIVDMFKNSPSEKAGLKVGDIILKVDDVDYSDKTSTDMSTYVKNSKNKEVKLLVSRDGEEKVIVINREKIEIPYVEGEIIEKEGKKIGFINVSLFSSVVKKQFESKLKEFEKSEIDSLIIDVRGNNGGYLSSVTEIINMFLKKGDVIYQLKDNEGIVVKKDTTKESRDYPIAVLINGGSASASEILASAIKESYGGFIVGTNSFGKGTVQQTTTLPDGSMVKYTIQNWLTPEGRWLNESGVIPTHVVELSEDYMEDPIMEKDDQLNKAIELLVKENVSN